MGERARRSRRGFVGCCLFLAASTAAGRPLPIENVPVPLDPARPHRIQFGDVRFRGGLELRSSDPGFGGFSALRVSRDGARLTAITDRGQWLEARLAYDGSGRLTGLEAAEMGPVRGLEGEALLGKRRQDAESLAMLPEGSVLVGFEGWHRLWRYPRGRLLRGAPKPVPAPAGLDRAPSNGGLEALTALSDGRVLALTEELIEDGRIRGWVGRDGTWEPLWYRISGPLRPTGADLMPSGDVVVLERSYSPRIGNQIRLKRIAQADVVPGAELDGPTLLEIQPPLSVDNFEGVACRPGAEGLSLVYLISDDNFSARQRTLLFLFEVSPQESARATEDGRAR